MIDFYLRSPDWRQELAYLDEIQAEDDLHEERKQEREEVENDKPKENNSRTT